jgi:hypothetical protein
MTSIIPNIGDAAKLLWPAAHNRGLARFTGVPVATARSWNRGLRRPPVSVLRAIDRRLTDLASRAGSIAQFLRTDIARREREPRVLRGLMKLQLEDRVARRREHGRPDGAPIQAQVVRTIDVAALAPEAWEGLKQAPLAVQAEAG